VRAVATERWRDWRIKSISGSCRSPAAVSRPRRSEWPEKRLASRPAKEQACLISQAMILSAMGVPVSAPDAVMPQNSGRSS